MDIELPSTLQQICLVCFPPPQTLSILVNILPHKQIAWLNDRPKASLETRSGYMKHKNEIQEGKKRKDPRRDTILYSTLPTYIYAGLTP